MKKIIYYNLKLTRYFIEQLGAYEASQFERLNPDYLLIDVPQSQISDNLLNELNRFNSI